MAGLLDRFSSAPAHRTFDEDRPSLLVAYWISAMCLLIAAFRCIGRFVRVERLYHDDKMMLLALVPLLMRMALVHGVLYLGTNNTQPPARGWTQRELTSRRIGSGLVLAARVAYVATIWAMKWCIAGFYKRLARHLWETAYETALKYLRWFLAVSFGVTVITIFAECRPASHYWQVSPDPGPQCRASYAPVLTSAIFTMLTDLLIALGPVPAIIRSTFGRLKKFRLILTFILSLIPAILAGFRVRAVLNSHGVQQTRTLWAGIDVLASTVVANAAIVHSFARHRGEKKARYRHTLDDYERIQRRRREMREVAEWHQILENSLERVETASTVMAGRRCSTWTYTSVDREKFYARRRRSASLPPPWTPTELGPVEKGNVWDRMRLRDVGGLLRGNAASSESVVGRGRQRDRTHRRSRSVPPGQLIWGIAPLPLSSPVREEGRRVRGTKGE